MKKNRLLKVAALIEVINPDSFDMDSWSAKKNECGTTFCACGYAAHVGLIKGFKLQYGRPSYNGTLDASLKYQNFDGWYAVQKVFDIGEEDATFLFSGREDDTPSSVAARIREYVATEGKSAEDEDI